MSPTSAGGSAYTPRRAAPEPNKRALYVGGLDPRVTEDVLRQIFETTGHVQSVKIIPDKTSSARTHVVRRGDTLSGLAKRYGVTVADLRKENGLSPETTLRAGESIRIPG